MPDRDQAEYETELADIAAAVGLVPVTIEEADSEHPFDQGGDLTVDAEGNLVVAEPEAAPEAPE